MTNYSSSDSEPPGCCGKRRVYVIAIVIVGGIIGCAALGWCILSGRDKVVEEKKSCEKYLHRQGQYVNTQRCHRLELQEFQVIFRRLKNSGNSVDSESGKSLEELKQDILKKISSEVQPGISSDLQNDCEKLLAEIKTEKGNREKASIATSSLQSCSVANVVHASANTAARSRRPCKSVAKAKVNWAGFLIFVLEKIMDDDDYKSILESSEPIDLQEGNITWNDLLQKLEKKVEESGVKL